VAQNHRYVNALEKDLCRQQEVTQHPEYPTRGSGELLKTSVKQENLPKSLLLFPSSYCLSLPKRLQVEGELAWTFYCSTWQF